MARTPKSEQRAITRSIASEHEKPARKIFLEATNKVRSAIVVTDLERAVAIHSLPEIERTIPLDLYGQELQKMSPRIRRAVQSGAEIAIEHFPVNALSIGKSSIVFDVLSPAVLNHIRNQAGAFVVDVTRTTRTGIRKIAQTTFEQGLHTSVATKRIKEMLGLTEHQFAAAEKLRSNLRSEGRKEEQIDRMVNRYASRSLNVRADTIARTEMAEAVNYGRQRMWDQAASEGFLNVDGLEKMWLTSEDERTCLICMPLDHVRVPLNGMWTQENSALLHGPVTHPGRNVHPNCRCTAVLVPKRSR